MMPVFENKYIFKCILEKVEQVAFLMLSLSSIVETNSPENEKLVLAVALPAGGGLKPARHPAGLSLFWYPASASL